MRTPFFDTNIIRLDRTGTMQWNFNSLKEKMGIKKTHLEVKELLEKTATDPSKGITFRDLVRFTLLSKGIKLKPKGTSDPGALPEKFVVPDVVSTFVKV